MDLSTNYLGLRLRNPLVASAGPLSQTVDGVRGLVDAGVGAVVMYSLFEEQVRRQAALDAELAVRAPAAQTCIATRPPVDGALDLVLQAARAG